MNTVNDDTDPESVNITGC